MVGTYLWQRLEQALQHSNTYLSRIMGERAIPNTKEGMSKCLVPAPGNARVVFSYGDAVVRCWALNLLAEAATRCPVFLWYAGNHSCPGGVECLRRDFPEPASHASCS